MSIASRISVWADGESPTPSEYWGMYFEAEEDNVVVNMYRERSGLSPSCSLVYSTDGENWTNFDVSSGSTPVTLSHIGDRVFFRATTTNTAFNRNESLSYCRYFTLSGKAGCHGNIMSLLNGSDPDNVTITGNYCFKSLFYGCTSMTSAPELPATTLTVGCYKGMFSGCTSLAKAPALPSVTLASECYFGMFENCTSLTAAPSLPATTLPDSCYQYMFNGCTSLTAAPVLPATNIPEYAYWSMFAGCTALTEAPDLPATTTGKNSYYQMFYGCSSLSSISVAFTNWEPTSQFDFYDWVNGVAASGTFTCPTALGTNATIARGTGRCPNGWTVENYGWEFYFEAEAANVTVGLSSVGTPPAVNLEMSDNAASWTPFTGTVTLANIGDRVYLRAATGGNARFASSESDYRFFTLSGAAGAHGNIMSLLNGTDTQNVTITGTYAFAGLFKNCGNLTLAPDLPATTLSNYCYCGMFEGCTSILTPPALPITTMQTGCYKRMFKGCSALTDVTGLSASAIVQDCCYEMFANCTSIAFASVGASSITSNGYAGLFNGCTSLNSLAVGFNSWGSDATYLADWVKGVAASGSFVCPTELGTDATIARGDNRCPLGWNVSAPQAYWWMYFEAEAANVVVNMAKSGSPSAVTLESSPDGITWTAFDSEGGTTPITLANIGDKVYFRAGTGGNTAFASSTGTYHNFTLSGAAGAHGNIMSLVDGEDENNLTIPGNYCFSMLFRGCSNLTTPPELPATTLTSDCYHGTFWECTNLASTPALPASTMQSGCYDTMFYNCLNVQSIDIAATTLANLCFSWMAYGCRSLNRVNVAFTDWDSQNNPTNYWLGGVSATGTFTCPAALGTDSTITRGQNNCPSGWTVVNI